MFKNTIIALSALGFVGAATVSTTTPADAFFSHVCEKKSKRYDEAKCKAREKARADRRAKWKAFWHGDRKKKG